ncbi:hypothetical protein B0T17DRAFT_297 [Bombardia bombarda]|uniref:Rhodopsin domain-containing protein n=1 Tax=Bombardia bombarda TaxID=252184 RepID=A0AA40CDB1_9PEZI|nr:hypothetical protein B0T17DRAFT_297 [Bombardia bombarda]
MGLFYNLSLCFTKISILLLYLRILVTFDYIRKATYITLAIVVIYNLWAFAVYFAMCIPLARAWDHNVKGSCRGATTWWAVASLHIITDFMIFLLPIPVVTTMTIPRRQKAGLLLAFAMGFFVCLVSLLRTLWLRDRVNSKDTTWDLVTIANWSIAEINVAILCACVPTLKPLLKKMDPWMHRLFPRHWTQDNNNNNEATSSSRPLTIGSIPLRVLGVEQGGRVNAGRPIEGQGVTERDREGERH